MKLRATSSAIGSMAASSRRLRAMGIRDKPTAAASPWQNGFAERLIGSIRRECLDHVIIWGEPHLRRILRSYGNYYNNMRTLRSLNKDAPISRPIQRIRGDLVTSDPRCVGDIEKDDDLSAGFAVCTETLFELMP
jgi:transposase InsO family protein